MSKERKTDQIVTRVTPAERAWLERQAKRAGIDLSSYIRMALKQVRVQLPQREAA